MGRSADYCMFCHSICLSGHVDWEIILLYHPFIQAKQKKKAERKLKTPPCEARKAISNCEPPWLASLMTLIHPSSGYQRLHATKNPYGDLLFFLHRRHALARPVFSPLRPASVGCLFAGKGPQRAAVPQSSSGMRFFFVCFFSTFKPRPHGVGDANSLLSVNFTSLAFVGPVYNTGEMWNKPSTRRRKLEPGLTICGIIKTVFVPPWLTLFASLFCSLLSFPPNFRLPCHRSVFQKSSFSLNALL